MNVSVSSHGTSFHVEDLSRVDRATRRGWGLEVAAYRHGGYPGPAAWVHAPIPIAGAWDLEPVSIRPLRVGEVEQHVRLTQVGVDFDTSADEHLRVTNLHIRNGQHVVREFNDLNEHGPTFMRNFNPPEELYGWDAINLSLGVEFPVNIDSPNPPPAPAIVFYAAYAFVTVAPA